MGHFQSRLLWKLGHQLYLNAASYLSGSDQSTCMSSHDDKSNCIYECCDVRTLYSWHLHFLCGKNCYSNSIIITISCKLSFPIVGLKISSHPIFALKSPLTNFLCCTLVTDRIRAVVPYERYSSNHYFRTFRTILSLHLPPSVIYDVLCH
jgi:hypothetical protein